MRKNLIRLATAGFFVAALLISLSSDSQGSINLVQNADAKEATGWKQYIGTCDDGTEITVCGEGNGACSPAGICP